MKGVMTPDQFRERMEALVNPDYHGYPELKEKEWGHAEGDDLLMEILESLGYEEGCAIFRSVSKWYA